MTGCGDPGKAERERRIFNTIPIIILAKRIYEKKIIYIK